MCFLCLYKCAFYFLGKVFFCVPEGLVYAIARGFFFLSTHNLWIWFFFTVSHIFCIVLWCDFKILFKFLGQVVPLFSKHDTLYPTWSILLVRLPSKFSTWVIEFFNSIFFFQIVFSLVIYIILLRKHICRTSGLAGDILSWCVILFVFQGIMWIFRWLYHMRF